MAPRLFRRFSETLAFIDRGAFEDKCTSALSEAVANLESQPTEKGKAKVTVTLELIYDKGMLQVLPSLQSKLPEAERSGATIFWVHDGALSTQHPSQIDLEDAIRETPKASTVLASG